jgi:hypothetical protein
MALRIVMSSGHGKYIRGAAGPPPWGLDEVDEARRVVERTAEALRGVGVDVITYHDDVSTSQSENLNRIVSFHDSKTRDLDVSLHFNAYESTSKPMGVECLYVSQHDLAQTVADKISAATGLPNRGAKKRTDLAFLNNTDEPAILVETLFVDSHADADAYHAKFEAICSALAEAISGQAVQPGPTPPRPVPPEPTPPDARRTISKGDKGEDVAHLQTVLGLPADGDFGSITQSWVKSFQAACGLSDDGVVGPLTWDEVDDLEDRMRDGETGLSHELEAAIDLVVQNSGLASYEWRNRGKAPAGYYGGMAKVYALAVKRLNDDDELAGIMAHAETGNQDKDALSWYADEFDEADMDNSESGQDTLRHLFVMMIGLGMCESSGDHWCGRDTTADNVESETCEAGLFQSSWNLSSCSNTIPALLDEYWTDPLGFRYTFTRGLSPSASDLDCYGSGTGARYQWLARYSPTFSALMTGVGMRKLRQHWGPINRREVDIVPQVDELLQQVDRLLDVGAKLTS